MLPLSPPELLTAVWNPPTSTVTLTYDRLLRPGTVAPGQINMRITNVTRESVVPSTIVDNTVVAPMGAPFGDLGPDVMNYLATPPEIFSRRGVAAPAEVDFPLT